MKKVSKLLSILTLIALILVGCYNSDNVNAKKIAEEFAKEIYKADSKKIDNYNALMKIDDRQLFAETMESNDKTLKSLMTESEYRNLVSNRQNLIYSQACSLIDSTMEVTDLTLSKEVYNIKENKAGYNFEIKLKLISNKDKSAQTDTTSGYIGLLKENGQWKVSVFKMNSLPRVIKGH